MEQTAAIQTNGIYNNFLTGKRQDITAVQVIPAQNPDSFALSEKKPEKSFMQRHWGGLLAGVAATGGAVTGIVMLVKNRNAKEAGKVLNNAASGLEEIAETKEVKKLCNEVSEIFDGVWAKITKNLKEQGLPECEKPKTIFSRKIYSDAVAAAYDGNTHEMTININHLQKMADDAVVVKSGNKTGIYMKEALDEFKKEGEIKPDAIIRPLSEAERKAFHTATVAHESRHAVQHVLKLHGHKEEYIDFLKTDFKKTIKDKNLNFKESDIDKGLQEAFPYVWNFKPQHTGKITTPFPKQMGGTGKEFYSSEAFLKGDKDVITNKHGYKQHTDAGYLGNPIEIDANLYAHNYLQENAGLFPKVDKEILDLMAKRALHDAVVGIKAAEKAGITYALPTVKTDNGSFRIRKKS